MVRELLPVEQQVRWALDYIVTTYDESKLRHHREEIRDKIKQWMFDNLEPEDDGSYFWEFEEPVGGEGSETIYGLRLQRREIRTLNEDKAWNLVADKLLWHKCVVTVSEDVLDFDAMYAMNTEGVISDEEFDDLFDVSEAFSLVRVTE